MEPPRAATMPSSPSQHLFLWHTVLSACLVPSPALRDAGDNLLCHQGRVGAWGWGTGAQGRARGPALLPAWHCVALALCGTALGLRRPSLWCREAVAQGFSSCLAKKTRGGKTALTRPWGCKHPRGQPGVSCRARGRRAAVFPTFHNFHFNGFFFFLLCVSFHFS